jgi:hypothetical protein
MNHSFTYNVFGSGNESPIVYSLSPGSYRISVGAQAKTNPLMTLLVGTMSYSYNNYALLFVFTVKPGQVVYLGDLLFDKQLYVSYDIEKIQADLAEKQVTTAGYEWVSLKRTSKE